MKGGLNSLTLMGQNRFSRNKNSSWINSADLASAKNVFGNHVDGRRITIKNLWLEVY
jgi:hypothetical protein